MKIKYKISKIGLLFLAVLHCLTFSLLSLQTIYYGAYNPIALIIYSAFSISILIFTDYLLLKKINIWFPLLVISSLLLGFIPYDIMVPNSIDLITSSNPQLSGLGEKFGLPIGIYFDLLFYPLLHFILLFLSKIVLNYRFQNNST